MKDNYIEQETARKRLFSTTTTTTLEVFGVKTALLKRDICLQKEKREKVSFRFYKGESFKLVE